MAYFYEKVIAAREAKMKRTYSSIYGGIFIDRRIVDFELVEIIKGKFRMMIPCDFVTMPPKMMKSRFPYGNSSLIVKTSLDLSNVIKLSISSKKWAVEKFTFLHFLNGIGKLFDGP